MAQQSYNLADIRNLLTQGSNDRELRRLCFGLPNLRPVLDGLAQGTGKDQIVDELIEYAEKHVQMGELLALVQERNPERYDLHSPYILKDPTLAIQKQAPVMPSATSLTPAQQY